MWGAHQEFVSEEKTEGKAGRSRSLWFLKSKLNPAFALKR
jgi:hypothetical protein